MKKILIFVFTVVCLSNMVFAKSKKTTVKDNNEYKSPVYENNETVKMPYYLPGYEGDVKSLVILKPEGNNLDEVNEWLLSFIQTQLIDNFTLCSPITISDRQSVEKAQNEIGKQEDGSYNEDNIGAKYGEAVGATHMLIGQLTNTEGAYNLSLRINDITKNITVTSVKKSNIKLEQIKDGSIINEATDELLTELGVQITLTGRKKLYEISNENLQENQKISKKNPEKSIPKEENPIVKNSSDEKNQSQPEKKEAKTKDKIVEGVKNYLKHNRRDAFSMTYSTSKKTDYKVKSFRIEIDEPVFSHIYCGINGSLGKYSNKEKAYDIQGLIGLNFYNSDKSSALFVNSGLGFGSNYKFDDSLFLSASLGFDLSIFEISYMVKFVPVYVGKDRWSSTLNIGLVFN